MLIQFQTNSLIPAPFAHAIELKTKEKNGFFEVKYELTYLDRENIDQEELEEEGFTGDDDLTWEGALPKTWNNTIEKLSSAKVKEKSNLHDEEDFWYIKTENHEGYPIHTEMFSNALQELLQAILEAKGFEAELNISLKRIDNNQTEDILFKASFLERKFTIIKKGLEQSEDFSQLNAFLKKIYGAEFRPDQAAQKAPKRNGIFLNLGDDLWYELGKSYLIQPSKIQSFFQ